MHSKKKVHPNEKSNLHPRNKNRGRYDFGRLVAACPELAPVVRQNAYGDESIDFADPEAVKALNKALLVASYGLTYWDIPDGFLCPPVPGRADYIHHLADLLSRDNGGQIPTGSSVRCLDVGTGANVIYPIIGVMEYGWTFVGSDIDEHALESARKIILQNSELTGKIDLRQQTNSNDIFRGIIQPNERFDLTVCNPPFHASQAEAESGTMRKLRNLNKATSGKSQLNFGGRHHELWCEGGEAAFVRKMIQQSRQFATSCLWFSTLMSKQEKLKGVYRALRQAEAKEVETIPMGQGNKTSRLVGWTFLSKAGRQEWVKKRFLKI
ncbi:23S rRNA (adenine(1618)-N(6))-methyltransferase RlmF [Sunxiuqinia dokdonensis]|uniref:Ribosomal RNA large subunit methyltransferase F n=1 Tax=Sunxiuqinia dokdonensis TaxID=1409788 RepID=A0A0L8V9J0_9BACT|nr:23S rRNA (adenine(1618)-N(6))-methyltransferase RlmF [Sunxiuqinia dokdonensis]KOH45104.1 16S rRNA methyltransferase [Sunxiuqinia dokdonensis]